MTKALKPLISEEVRAQHGELFLKLVREPGWAVFVSLMERRRSNIGSASLDDSPKMHKYWLGRRDEIDELLQEVYSLVEEVVEMQDVEPEVMAAMTGQRISGPRNEDDDDLEEG